MTDTEFENLVDQLFAKHCTKLGGDHWSKGDDGIADYSVLDFAKELRDVLNKEIISDLS